MSRYDSFYADQNATNADRKEDKSQAFKFMLAVVVVSAAATIDYRAYKRVTKATGMNQSVFMAVPNGISAVTQVFNKSKRANGLRYLQYLSLRSLWQYVVRIVVSLITA